jgi:hypothetical protein
MNKIYKYKKEKSKVPKSRKYEIVFEDNLRVSEAFLSFFFFFRIRIFLLRTYTIFTNEVATLQTISSP